MSRPAPPERPAPGASPVEDRRTPGPAPQSLGAAGVGCAVARWRRRAPRQPAGDRDRQARRKATSRNGFATDLDVARDTVADLATCGRARWKVENETFNVLKTHGYNRERTFGHGRKTLSGVPDALNLPVFAMHTASDLIEAAWRRARRETGTRMRLFARLRTIAAHHVFPSWQALMTALITGLPPPAKA